MSEARRARGQCGWGGLGVDSLVLALVMPHAAGHPTTAGQTVVAVLVVAVSLLYWAGDLLMDGRACTTVTYLLKLPLLAAMAVLVDVLPAARAGGGGLLSLVALLAAGGVVWRLAPPGPARLAALAAVLLAPLSGPSPAGVAGAALVLVVAIWYARARVGLDTLVLLLVLPQVLAPLGGPGNQLAGAFALGLLLVYGLLSALAARTESRGAMARLEEGGHGGQSSGGGMAARAERLQTMLLVVVIVLLVVWPAVSATLARHRGQPYTYVTDNAMQTEYATAFLLAGQNPYAMTYDRTPMARWYADSRMTQALYHADELPLNLLITAPVRALAGRLAGWFDERFVLLPLLGLALVCLWRLGGSGELRRARVAAVALAPFAVPAYIYGDTDVVALAGLAAALLALARHRRRTGALLTGVALAVKQTVFCLWPLYLAYLWGTAPAGASWRTRAGAVWRTGRWSLVVPVATVAPFIAWNSSAFWAGTVGFVAGTVPHAYPMRGIGAYGVAALVALGRLAPSTEGPLPLALTLLEVVCVGPLLVVLCLRLARRPSLGLLVSSYAVVMGVTYFFSRFLQDGGLGYLVLVVALACLLPADDAHRLACAERLPLPPRCTSAV